jgi:hypothetical protein
VGGFPPGRDMLRAVRPPPFPPLAVLADALSGVASPELEGAALEARPQLELSPELEAVYWVPLSSLVPVTARVAELPGSEVPAYDVVLPCGEPLVVWGITYAILERLRALTAE